MEELDRQKDLPGGQYRNHLHRETSNGGWISPIPHHLNGKEMSQEGFQDNLHLRYGLMPQNILATCNGFGKNFSIKNFISCPKGGLVLARHEDSEKYWGDLGAWSLTPSVISY